MSKIKAVYFSPSGTTEKTARTIVERISGEKEYHDILSHRLKKRLTVEKDQLLVLVLPVFGGRIPDYCHQSLMHISGDGSPAVIVCVYGNREFEDALVEMEDIVTRQGFNVIGAGAFVAQHSIFNSIAQDRPDETDVRAMEEFGEKCGEKLDKYDSAKNVPPAIPGNRPYRKLALIPLTPKGSRACTNCRACVNICPVDAISGSAPRKTDKTRCIACTACISHCPIGARKFSGFKYSAANKKLTGMCKKRKEPEIFI